MEKRYPHFLRRATAGKNPARIVALSVDSRVNAELSTSIVEHQELNFWAACGSEQVDGLYVHRLSKVGEQAETLWQSIEWAAKRGGNTLIVSYGCSRVWGLLGLWSKLESGEVSFWGIDDEDGQPGVSVVVPALSDVVSRNIGMDDNGQGTSNVPVVRTRDMAIRVPYDKGRSKGANRGATAIVEDPPTILVIRLGRMPGRITLVDCRNWGIECYPKEWKAPARASWLHDAIVRMVATIDREGWGSLKTTAGSQALFTYRARYMTHAVHCHVNNTVLAVESDSYVGGRCECFRMGWIKTPVVHLDFRSLYPFVCTSERLPVRFRSSHADGQPPEEWQLDNGKCLIGEVTVNTATADYPYRRASDVIWPIGTFKTTLCGPELLDAWRMGRIVKWHRYCVYDGEPALKEYALAVWRQTCNARARNDKALTQWLKAMSVCLPGKLGQRAVTWIDYPDATPPAPYCQWYEDWGLEEPVRCRSIAWQSQFEYRQGWATESVPAIASWITSAGRMRLLRAIRQAGRSNVFYCDTDSLIVNTDGYMNLCKANLVRDDVLGYLRVIERDSKTEIRGLKDYTIAGNTRCSGMPRGLCEPGPDLTCYWYSGWLKKSLQEGRRPEVKRILRQYRRDGEYKHGVVGSDGKVSPIVVNE